MASIASRELWEDPQEINIYEQPYPHFKYKGKVHFKHRENCRNCTVFKYLQPPVFLLKPFRLKYSKYIRRKTLNLPAKSAKSSSARETGHLCKWFPRFFAQIASQAQLSGFAARLKPSL